MEGKKLIMAIRDTLMDAAYFDHLIDLKKIRGIEGGLTHLSVTPASTQKGRAQFIYTLFKYHCDILLMRYSRGDGVTELKNFLPELVAAWETAFNAEAAAFTEAEMAGRKRFDRNLDIYVICLWLVSLALCLKVDDALFARILTLCGNEGADWLFELLAGARVKGRQSAPALCYPKTYGLLKFAVEAQNPPERERLMKAFLQRWYASLSKTYWHDNHKGPDGGGYFGYWCFEAAGVVAACGFDDRALRDLPHYPKDLAAPFSAL